MDPEHQPGDVFGSAPLLHNNEKTSPSSRASLTQEQQPRRTDYRTANGKYWSYLLRNLYGPLKFVVIFGLVALFLAIPLIIIGRDEVKTREEIGSQDAFATQQNRQLIYYVFAWLFLSWLGLAIFYAIGTVLPYIFRFIARYVLDLHSENYKATNATTYQICKPGTCAVLAYHPHTEKAHMLCRLCHHLVHLFRRRQLHLGPSSLARPFADILGS